MKSIITISREFGSGGRELGKRLAAEMNYRYYDRDILEAIRLRIKTDQWYLEKILEGIIHANFPIRQGRSIVAYQSVSQADEILEEHQAIIKELAQAGDSVFVGRGANILLHDFETFNLFVYSSMSAKLMRCKNYAPSKEHFSEEELCLNIQKIEAIREQIRHSLASDDRDAGAYHLCINTSGLEIRKLIPLIVQYAKHWMAEENHSGLYF